LNPAAVLALADQAGVSFSISAAGTLKAKGGREQVACLAPLIKEHKDALLAHLKALEHGTEICLGTVASPSNVSVAARCAEYVADENWCYRHTPDGYQWKTLPPGKHEWRRRNNCVACDWIQAGGAGLGR
jgi:hypothetical protein